MALIKDPITGDALKVNSDGSVKVNSIFADDNGVPYGPGNRLPVDVGGTTLNVTAQFDSRVSTLNSSFVPLAANAVFVGQWEEVIDYAAISCTIYTDAPSAQNGAVIQWSHNATDLLSQQFASIVPTASGAFFSLAPQGRYFRIIYTNGATAQTVLRSEVTLLFNPPAHTQGPIGNPATDLSIGTTQVSHLKGRIMSGPFAGVWDALGTDGAGRLQVAQEPIEDKIAFYATAAGGTKAFNITTDIITIAASGTQPLAVLVNPANSGVDIYLDLGEFGSSANTTFRRLRNATLTLTGTPKEPTNMGGGANTSPIRFYPNGTFTATGGTVAKTAHIAAFQQYLTHLKGRVRLRPGNSLFWNISGPGGLGGSMTASIFFEYWEVPAT